MDSRAALSSLGLPPGSTPDAIRDAYRDLVKVWHPDRFPGDERLQAKASERMRELNEAYRVLTSGATASETGAASRRNTGTRPAAQTAPGPTPARPPAAVPTEVFLSFDRLWRSLFFAVVCGAVIFVFTAPEGFFALGRGRGVAKRAPGVFAEPVNYARLPESDTGDATLVARIRGTWVVVEHERGSWLPVGTRLDVRGSRLSCALPDACDAAVRSNGASRLSLRGPTPDDARDVEVLFASPTAMLWLVRPAGEPRATPARVVLHAQGVAAAAAAAP